jgi:hypothetical protein
MSLPAQAGNTFQANPTIAAGDFQVSTDGSAFTNLDTIPAVTPASGKIVKVTLSVAEMGGDNVTVVASDAAGSEWDDVTINIQTSANHLDDIKTETALILADTAVIGALGAGLTAIPWNSAWDAEVESEVTDALTAYNAVATTDLPTNFGDMSISITTGLVDITQTAADKVWSTAARILTASTNFNDIAATDVVSGGAITTSGGAVSTVTTLSGHTAQTGDNYARLGAPAGASIAADLVVIDNFVDGLETTIGTPSDFGSGTSTIAANLQDIADDGTEVYSRATDSLQAIRDRGDAAWVTGGGGADKLVLQDTTIATLASQTEFTLTAGSGDNDAYNNCTIVVEDVSTATQKAVGMVLTYVGSSKTVTLKEALAFTIATTDKVYILAENSLKSTVANRQLDVTSTGESGIDWANISGKTTTHDFTNTTIGTTTTNTDMVADVSSDVTAIKTETDKFVFTVANQLDVNTLRIEGFDATDQINAACDTSMTTYGLHQLVSSPALGSNIVNNSIMAQIVAKGTSADWDTFKNETDSLQAQGEYQVLLSKGAGAASKKAESATVTTGTETLTYTATHYIDSSSHQITPSGGNIEMYYQFDVGSSGVATAILWLGFGQNTNDTLQINAYDWVAAAFKPIGTDHVCEGGGDQKDIRYVLDDEFTGTGGDIGKVRFQVTSSTATDMYTNRVLCEYITLPTAVATAAAMTTVDTNVDAIKAKTDDLTFTVANELDSNIQSVNDTTVTGDGQSGTEWGS